MNRAALLGLALACLGAAGCHDPVTEVVVVMTSDISIPGDADTITLLSGPGIGPPPNFGQGLQNSLSTFPLSMGFVSDNGGTGVFSMTVQLTRLSSNFQQQIVISRTVTGIRFVPKQTRMLVLSLPKACACVGTSCPNPGTNPDCDNLENPITEPFDPARAPPSGQFQQAGPGPGPVPRPDANMGIVDPGFSSDGGGGRPDGFAAMDGARPEGGTPEGGTSDGGTPDGGTPDGGTPDGGTMDGSMDGGATEGGSKDGAAREGGAPDGGSADGGGSVDAGIG